MNIDIEKLKYKLKIASLKEQAKIERNKRYKETNPEKYNEFKHGHCWGAKRAYDNIRQWLNQLTDNITLTAGNHYICIKTILSTDDETTIWFTEGKVYFCPINDCLVDDTHCETNLYDIVDTISDYFEAVDS